MSQRWKKYIAVCIILILAVTSAIFLLSFSRASNQTIATVYLDGVPIYTVDLSQVTQTETFTVGTSGAQNTIQVSPEGIAIIQADCPDQVCVHQGVRAHGPTPIVCLPHHLTVRFSSGETADALPDAVSGMGA